MNFLSPRLLRPFTIFSAAFFLIPVAPQLAQAQSQSSPPTRKPPPPPPAPPATNQQQFVSYWTTETGWRTELQLRNNQVSQILTVTPVLRTPDGVETPLSPLVVQPQEIKTVDVATAIGTSAPQLIGTYGSLALRYHTPSEANLYAVSMVMGVGHSIAFHIDAIGEDQTENVGSREGIWWLPNGTASDYLVLLNQGQNALQLRLSLFDASGKTSIQNLTLAPRAMNRLSISQLVTAAKLSGSYGGIKVSAVTHAGSLDTLHVLFDERAGFSAVMKMFNYDPRVQVKERDYAKTGQWTLRAPMLALSTPDPALAFPVGTILLPQLLVRNTTSKPIDASLTFNWRTDTTTGRSPGSALHLYPNETRRIDVAALQDGKTLPQNAQWASVTLATTGLPDEVVAVAASYDQSLRYGAQTPFSDQLAFHWVGSQWEYDAQHDSIITTGNGGTKPTQAAFTIFYNQGTQKYQMEQTLRPGEQMWIDIGKLIREQIPDKNGKVLPADLTTGSYEIRDLTNKFIGTLFEGKVIYDKTYGHATYGCGSCCGFYGTKLWYDPLGIPFNSDSYQGVYGHDKCGGLWEDISDSFNGNWNTANSNIATVDYYGTHTGMSIGSTTTSTSGQFQGYLGPNNCPIVGGAPSGGDNATPAVTIGSFSQNPILQGTTATVQITVNPSGTITLTIASSGSGRATFDNQNGGTTKTISGSTTVTIYGSATSTSSGDLTLSASYGGSVLEYAAFTVSNGGCSLGSENDTGSGSKICSSTVTLQSNYTINQYCSTCTYSCQVHTDGAWTPNSCSATSVHVGGALTGTETTSATGTFSASDCNWHYAYFITTATNAQNVQTNYTGGSIGVKCTAYPNQSPCP